MVNGFARWRISKHESGNKAFRAACECVFVFVRNLGLKILASCFKPQFATIFAKPGLSPDRHLDKQYAAINSGPSPTVHNGFQKSWCPLAERYHYWDVFRHCFRQRVCQRRPASQFAGQSNSRNTVSHMCRRKCNVSWMQCFGAGLFDATLLQQDQVQNLKQKTIKTNYQIENANVPVTNEKKYFANLRVNWKNGNPTGRIWVETWNF